MAKDYTEIKADYIAGNDGYRKLADRYGVSVNALAARAKKENWPALRKRYRDKRGTDLVTRYARADKKKLESVFRASEALAERLDKMLQDPEQFNKYLERNKETGELKTVTLDVWNVKSMQTAGKLATELAGLIRELNRIPTQQQAEAQYIARRKLEIEEERMQAAASDEGGETGVIMLGD